MIPEEVFKRRHYGTPQIFTLIVTNSVLICLIVPFFATCGYPNIYFWIFVLGLTIYNIFTVRRFRDEFNKVTIIAYIIGILVDVAGILLLIHKNCNPSS
ncbi:hypothetical protein [Mucilaginibacter sp. KACC 22063]|uniref:hypothetical protein n=1 Tax=Mucilaginibacter sp. KACC 22063 TaxID=3025666 RepID=UPI0023650E7A|nr:hypothetical protein [Mucilaginibacter sp. KACC 22063]WDF55091.1 hypothetical protein PQ461_19360 [Mucilaginibacter sp. KACC 22063]